MKRVHMTAVGGPEVLELADVAEPEPGPETPALPETNDEGKEPPIGRAAGYPRWKTRTRGPRGRLRKRRRR